MADPGFSRGRCANSEKCYYFSIFFCRKLHENERIWTPGKRGVPGAPLDPPMELCMYYEWELFQIVAGPSSEGKDGNTLFDQFSTKTS